jgi:hypothetical protein
MSKAQVYLGKGWPCKLKAAQKNFRALSKVQPIYVSQSYYNGDDPLEFIQAKLQIHAAPKHRTKTEVGRGGPHCGVSLSEKEGSAKYLDPIMAAIRSKSTFKGKYLEVNCLRGRPEEQEEPRRKVGQGGAVTRISTRPTRQTDQGRRLIFNSL